MTARLCQAVAVARNGVIGAEGGLAWKISDDLKSFKAATIGKPIIMGRKTFDSIGRPLPGRDNIVVTRAPSFSAPGIFVARTIEGAVKLARGLAAASGGGSRDHRRRRDLRSDDLTHPADLSHPCGR